MTDRDKIKAEVIRLIKRDEMVADHNSQIMELVSKELDCLYHLSKFIDSLPEEHPYKTGDKVWYLNELYTLKDDGKHYILTSVRNNSIVHLDYGDEDFKLLPYEKPVNKNLEEAAKRYALNNTPFEDCTGEMSDAFKAGAQWQKNQGIVEEAEINYWNQGGLSIRTDKSLEYLGYEEGDKVKIIIVKE